MTIRVPHRRSLLAVLLGGGAVLPIATAAAAPARKPALADNVAGAQPHGLVPDFPGDQIAALQAAIDRAAIEGQPLVLPAGRFRVSGVRLRTGSHIVGGARTVLQLTGPGDAVRADGAHGLRLERLRIEGPTARRGQGRGGLVDVRGSREIAIEDVTIVGGMENGLALTGCSGRVAGCRISGARGAGLFSLDATGLEIAGNTVSDCGDNGILVWRTTVGEDGSIVTGNRIERIGAASGGTGQNGNGVNVFRAGGVSVRGNRITDCAYSAVRANAASNVQIVANSVQRIGEVALYAEFGFEGALIAQNIVDGAAAGIAVTNFNEGGRLAVIQGNLIRNLARREHEPVDKRGEGIAVEADAAVSGNTIEGAPTAGIVIGWGRYMRDVAATGNVIRGAPIGIMITRAPEAGQCLVAQNLIAGARDGAIRLADHGRPLGEDLARAAPRSERIVIIGNVATAGIE